MNKDETAYAHRLWGNNRGYVAVAAKRGEREWTEATFAWPRSADKLYAWVDARRTTHDVFVCPSLRRTRARAKNDGVAYRWLWADVDWDKVPANQRRRVADRINEVMGMSVASGSGENRHVYVELDQEVDQATFNRLNQGLRDHLHADNKHADNSLLRWPLTTNHKPGASNVGPVYDTGAVMAADTLLAMPTWRAVVVKEDVDSDGAYDVVDVAHLLRGSIKALVSMDIEEAVGRYGSRHGAVYRVTATLAKRGLSSDEIHTLMAAFVPGKDKEDTERGYDMHADIDRCLGQQPARDAVDTQLAEDVVAQGDVFGEPDDALDDAADRVHAMVLKRIETWEIDRLAREHMAQRTFTPPPPWTSDELNIRLSLPAMPNDYAVDRIAGNGHNITLTGQFKTGKTMFVANLVRSVVENTPVLGEYKPKDLVDGTVGLWSLEMNDTDLVENYLRPQGISEDHAQAVMMWHGRGYGMNLMTDVGKAWAVNWLTERDTSVWVIDSFARICRMAGVDENDNGAVLGLLGRLDEVKESARVDELYLVAHTGRGEMAEGKERARGATSLDDWADTRWVLTRDDSLRWFQCEGRGVDTVPATSLAFDPDTKHLTITAGETKNEAMVTGGVKMIESLVRDHDGELSQNKLIALYRERASTGSKNTDAIRGVISECVALGFVCILPGAGRSKLFSIPTKPAGGATPQVVDWRQVRDGAERSRRKR